MSENALLPHGEINKNEKIPRLQATKMLLTFSTVLTH